MDRLESLEAFAAVAETRSFVGAARRLGRSAASITRTVAALERSVGSRLLNRTTRAVSLTDAGVRYLASAQPVLRELAALDATLGAAADTPSGIVRMTAPVVMGQMHVGPAVGEFLRRHPAVDVRLTLRDDVVSLVDEGLDLGIRIAQLRDSTLRRVAVGSVRRGVYASPAYLAAHGVPMVPGDLARHACVAFAGAAGGIDRWSFGAGGRAIIVPIRPRLVVNLAEPAIDAAIAGVGVTRVLSYMVVDAVRAGRLRRVLQRWEPPAVPVQVVHPAGRHLSPTVQLLVDHVVASLRRRLAG